MATTTGKHHVARNYMLSMIPGGDRHLSYKDRFVLDDNLDIPLDVQAIHDSDITSGDIQPLKLQFVSIIFVTGGSLDVRLNLVDYHLQAGDTIIVVPGIIGDYVNISPDAHIGTISFSQYDYPFITDNRLSMSYSHEALRQPLCFKLPEKDMKAWLTLYRQMHDMLSDPDFLYKDDYLDGAMRCFTAIYVDAYNHYKPIEENKSSRFEEIFMHFLNDVREHYTEHRDLAFYAEQQCITPKYLSKAVTIASKRHPAEWISDYVILDAKAMLLSGDYTIQEVSEALSFTSQSFFGRYFRQAVGCAPGQYKQRTLQTYKQR